MKNAYKAIIILLVLLCNSCATKALWENTDPNEYVKIEYTEITEEELKARGVKYLRDDKRQAFYVEKNSFSRFKDYSYRVLATPVTIVIDTTAVVVCAAAYIAYEHEMKNAVDDYCTGNPLCGN